MSRKNPNSSASDADVADILAKLDETDPPSEASIAELIEHVPVAMASPASLDFAPEADEESDGSLAADTPPDDDDKPLRINIPHRDDPTKILVADGIPQVQVVDANGNLANDPAARADAIVISTTVTPPPPGAPGSITIPSTAAVAASVAPLSDPGQALPEGVKEVLEEVGATAWLNADDPKPYWTVRRAGMQVGIPVGVTADEWRARLNSIAP